MYLVYPLYAELYPHVPIYLTSRVHYVLTQEQRRPAASTAAILLIHDHGPLPESHGDSPSAPIVFGCLPHKSFPATQFSLHYIFNLLSNIPHLIFSTYHVTIQYISF